MGCLVVLLAILSPRLALFCVWLFSDLLSRAFEAWWIPLAGFFFLPWTTLVYALCWDSSHQVAGFEWFLVGFAFVVDVGSWLGGRRERLARS